MNVHRQALVAAAEETIHIWGAATPLFTQLAIPGVRGQIGPTSFPPLNAVGMARLDEQTVDAAIAAVIDRFESEDRAFAWAIGPSSTPADLADRLEAAGLQRFEELVGMALLDLDQEVPSSPTVRIEEVSTDRMRSAATMMATAFGLGMTAEDAVTMVEGTELVSDRYPSRWYLAFDDGGEAPVGFSFMIGTDVPQIVLFGGAATLPANRGRGIYRSFVARRLRDARAQGAQAAVIQAVRGTSAPICGRLGFEELCPLDVYAWVPGGSALAG
jgi:hypothetical protein